MVSRCHRQNRGTTTKAVHVFRRSADLSANPMQVSSREISEAWHIRNEVEAGACRFGTINRNMSPRVGFNGFNLTASYSVSSEMIGYRLLSPYLERELQI